MSGATDPRAAWLGRVLGLKPAAGGVLAAFNEALAAFVGELKPALAAKAPGAEESRAKASEAGLAARKQDFAAAAALLEEARRLLAQGGTKTAARASRPLSPGMAAWQKAREAAHLTLANLARAIADMNDPDGDEAIILVRAIMANLTEEPATLQQVEALVRYVTDDGIVQEAEAQNGFGIEVVLRTPLLEALAVLAREQASQGRGAA